MKTIVRVIENKQSSGLLKMSEMRPGDMAIITSGLYVGNVIWKPTEKSPYIIMNQAGIEGGQNSFDEVAARAHLIKLVDATITVEI